MNGTVTRADGWEPTIEWPDPTPEMLNDPTFEAIWLVIKSWDINVPEYYDGYCGANGSHVAMILNALKNEEGPDDAGPSGA